MTFSPDCSLLCFRTSTTPSMSATSSYVRSTSMDRRKAALLALACGGDPWDLEWAGPLFFEARGGLALVNLAKKAAPEEKGMASVVLLRVLYTESRSDVLRLYVLSSSSSARRRYTGIIHTWPLISSGCGRGEVGVEGVR